MATRARISYRHGWYHIYNRGVGRQNIFLQEEDYLKFISLLDKASKRFNMSIHAYCLMGNHYHLIMQTHKNNLSVCMNWIMNCYVKYFNRVYHRDGPLFRSRFQSKTISEERYLLKLSAYIHNNPVKDKFVEEIKNYRWSSYHAYVGGSCDMQYLKTQDIKKRFDKLKGVSSYKEFVLKSNESMAKIYEQMTIGYRLESNCSSSELHKRFREKSLLYKNKDYYEMNELEIKVIIEEVAKYYQCSIKEITHVRPGKRNLARATAIALSVELTEAHWRTISSCFGGISLSYLKRVSTQVKGSVDFKVLTKLLLK